MDRVIQLDEIGESSIKYSKGVKNRHQGYSNPSVLS